MLHRNEDGLMSMARIGRGRSSRTRSLQALVFLHHKPIKAIWGWYRFPLDYPALGGWACKIHTSTPRAPLSRFPSTQGAYLGWHIVTCIALSPESHLTMAGRRRKQTKTWRIKSKFVLESDRAVTGRHLSDRRL